MIAPPGYEPRSAWSDRFELGGSREANEFANADSRPKVIGFLQEAFSKKGRSPLSSRRPFSATRPALDPRLTETSRRMLSNSRGPVRRRQPCASVLTSPRTSCSAPTITPARKGEPDRSDQGVQGSPAIRLLHYAGILNLLLYSCQPRRKGDKPNG